MGWREDTQALARQANAIYGRYGWSGLRGWIDEAPSHAEAWRRVGVVGAFPGHDCPACDGCGATPESAQLVYNAATLDEALAMEPERCRLCRGSGRHES